MIELREIIKAKGGEIMNENKMATVGSLAFGVVIGYLAGVLLLPKSGKEIREDISEGFENNKNLALDQVESNKEALGGRFLQSKNMSKDFSHDAQSMVDKFSTELAKLAEKYEKKVIKEV